MPPSRTLSRPTVERHLRIALQHVAVGERLIDRQRALVMTLEEHGHPTRIARKLLTQFEDVQAMHVADRDRLVDELARRAD
ncbi:hypothetical protein SAMN02990966_07754 [Rhodospirillales bacterium URHD0017]|nr:hypothetical protein SAMN02990966_07754 [Rhodospirillales bacterium URHD0017]